MSKKLSFDSLYGVFCSAIDRIVDHRSSNISYSLTDVVKSGFAIFSLKSPSLLSYEHRSISEEKNFLSVYKIEKIPSDTSMRETLDKVSWRPLVKTLSLLYRSFKKYGDITSYHILGKRLLVAIDGVHHFSSEKIKCDHCLTKKHSNGQVSYHHSMLCAVLVHPDRSEVIPLSCEPIINSDGNTKNDCELSASKRLLSSMLSHYKNEKFILIEDALYANNPNIKLINEQGWNYILRVKPSSNKTIFSLYEGRKSRNQLKEHIIEKDGERHSYSYMNNVSLTNHKDSVRVNFVHYEYTNSKGVVKIFDWITDIKISTRSVADICRSGRSRWKIENETFNTLKNQGYHFNHNYGHGNENLSTVLAVLMLIAFSVDQIQQIYSQVFRAIMGHLKTRKKLWEAMRNVFTMIAVDSMHSILIIIAQNWQVKLDGP